MSKKENKEEELPNIAQLLKHDNPGGNRGIEKFCGIIDTGEPVDAKDVINGKVEL